MSDKLPSAKKKLAVRDFRCLATELIRACPKSRQQIAEEMTAILKQPVTARMLDGFTSESKKGHRFPVEFLEAFSEVVGSDELQRFVAGARLRALADVGEFFGGEDTAQQLKQMQKLCAELLKQCKR